MDGIRRGTRPVSPGSLAPLLDCTDALHAYYQRRCVNWLVAGETISLARTLRNWSYCPIENSMSSLHKNLSCSSIPTYMSACEQHDRARLPESWRTSAGHGWSSRAFVCSVFNPAPPSLPPSTHPPRNGSLALSSSSLLRSSPPPPKPSPVLQGPLTFKPWSWPGASPAQEGNRPPEP